MRFDIYLLLRELVSFFVILLFSLCFHEVAHGLMAKWKGDPTAKMMGRLTMNPMVHMDMMGTLILPLITIFIRVTSGANLPLFGWAKPVPVNTRYLKNPRADMFWIALAGPLSNILLAAFGTIVMVVVGYHLRTALFYLSLIEFFKMFVITNLFLAFFNLIPLNPLDGGKVLARFLPDNVNSWLEQNESMTGMILMFVILSGGTSILSIPVIATYNYLIALASGVLA